METAAASPCSIPAPGTVPAPRRSSARSGTGGALKGVKELSSMPYPSMGVGGFPEAELLGSCGWEVGGGRC